MALAQSPSGSAYPLEMSLDEALTLDPDDFGAYANIGGILFLLGNLQAAREWCEAKPMNPWAPTCLAVVYDKLGRHNDAQAELAKSSASDLGRIFPFIHAQIYVQFGDTAQVLEWLERAVHVRDWALEHVKMDPLLDPLRDEPRFQAIERELKFPN